MTVDNDDYEYETFLEETICPICGIEHSQYLVDKTVYFVDENNCRHPCEIQYFYCPCSDHGEDVYYFDKKLVENNFHKFYNSMKESPRRALKREKEIRNRGKSKEEIFAENLVGLIWDTVSKIYEKKDKKIK